MDNLDNEHKSLMIHLCRIQYSADYSSAADITLGGSAMCCALLITTFTDRHHILGKDINDKAAHNNQQTGGKGQ